MFFVFIYFYGICFAVSTRYILWGFVVVVMMVVIVFIYGINEIECSPSYNILDNFIRKENNSDVITNKFPIPEPFVKCSMLTEMNDAKGFTFKIKYCTFK